MLIKAGQLSVRKLETRDRHLLAKWLTNPKVLEFYEGRDTPFNLQRVQEKFYDRDNGVHRNVIVYEGSRIGYIQFYNISDKERQLYGYKDEIVIGMDQFIGEHDYWNRGIGQLLVYTMSEYLLESADLVVMDPLLLNERAIHCYEKSGFTKKRLMPKHLHHEGEYRDCLLMEKGKINLFHSPSFEKAQYLTDPMSKKLL
ncbi:GNAT family N-acetyltransferase [Metabacillus idriensis]|uniref:GNAT family N-acetyltransferase n=1 Tax=Metabacillus idriensis TaxID=324768 RepID=UPI00174A5B28|nr:GNAT family N-acetyltransferase [Metabacillus idriensis]